MIIVSEMQKALYTDSLKTVRKVKEKSDIL